MSKLVLALVLLLSLAFVIAAQDAEVRITILEAQPSKAVIEGRIAKPSSSIAFLAAYAGVKDLPVRISDLKMADTDRRNVEYKRLQTGEYVTERPFSWFTYNVDLSPQRDVLNSAHISSSNAGGAMLALDDLLPQPTAKLRLKLMLELPPGWRIISNDNRIYENILDIHDAQRAIVFVGPGWRVSPVGGTDLKVAALGDVQVQDDRIVSDLGEIYKAYVKIFESPPAGPSAQIAVVRAQGVSAGAWEAETRGSTVTIVTGGGLSPADAEQRLAQQLRHEIFHLWLPNGVNLTGNYDWFYEGFATYEEQKLGVSMNQIRFADFLATLGRAYDIDRFTSRSGTLIDASQKRWAGSPGQVYARGMLVAFLCDVAILDASKGKSSVESLLRQLVADHRPPAVPTDGNEAILSLMRSRKELVPIANHYVSGAGSVDWTSWLAKAGLEAEVRDQLTSISAVPKPNGRQRDLLDKLGYNSWQKLAPR